MNEIIEYLIDEKMNDIHTSLPARIEEINYEKGTCSVVIDGKRILAGKEVNFPKLIDVKMDFKSFGGWILQIPRKKGDKVWIGFSEIAENNISQERFSLNEPYIIGSREESYLNNSEDIVLSGKGTTILIKGNGEIEITTGANQMILNSNLKVNGNIEHSGNYTLTGNLEHTGITTHNGNLTVVGNVTASGGVAAGGISLKDHTHKYIPGDKPQTNTGGAE